MKTIIIDIRDDTYSLIQRGIEGAKNQLSLEVDAGAVIEAITYILAIENQENQQFAMKLFGTLPMMQRERQKEKANEQNINNE